MRIVSALYDDLRAPLRPERVYPVHDIELGPLTIGEGEALSYTVVGSQYSPEEGSGYYAGKLNVTFTGPIVIESGGCLSIGPVSIVGTEERSTIMAALGGETPLITVQRGGELIISCADFELTGSGTLIKQEPGGAVNLTDSTLSEDAVEWSGPVADNSYAAPKDVYLEVGTPLTEERLPAELGVYVLDRGQETHKYLALSWDLDGHHGKAQGECVLTGSFLDENGAPIDSMFPLTVSVYWYEPSELVVKEARWTGDQAAAATLLLESPPEELEPWDIRGQTSPDGRNWTDFENFEVTGSPEVGYSATFSLGKDNEPRHFRLVASNSDGSMYWHSKGFLLPTEEDSDEDQGGNRGGGTTLLPPLREPEPSPEPTPEPTPHPTPAPSSGVGSGGSGAAPDTIGSEHSMTPAPEPTPSPTPTPEPEPSPETTEPPEPEPSPEAPPSDDVEIAAPELPPQDGGGGAGPVTTAILAAAGIVVCGTVGLAVAKAGPFKKKK